jgi:hypothetical protein
MRFLAVLLCSASMAACSSDAPNAPTGPVNVQVVLAPGQTSEVSNTGLRLRFQGVSGDSRCPGDATCIWGGDAIVRVDVIQQGGGQRTIELHTSTMQPILEGDLTIAIEALSPYPFASLPPIAPGDYRATLRVTR